MTLQNVSELWLTLSSTPASGFVFSWNEDEEEDEDSEDWGSDSWGGDDSDDEEEE